MEDHIIHEHGESSSSNALIAVVIVLLVIVIGWFAYSQGFFRGKEEPADDSTIKVEIGGDSNDSAPPPGSGEFGY